MADLTLVAAGKLRIEESYEQFNAIAAEDLGIGQAVKYIPSSTGAGKVNKADATDATKGRAVGLVTAAVKAGHPVTVLKKGVVDGFDLSGLDYGASVFLSDTPGALADAAGTQNVKVGFVQAVAESNIGVAFNRLLAINFPTP